MSEWDFDEPSGNTKQERIAAGKWDAVQTLVAFVSVACVSFLTAWLTREIPSRPFWLLGLLFAAPVTALMFSVFMKEKASGSMTPSTSRKAQFILVLCSILAAAVVGCFCQVSNEKAGSVEEVLVEDGWSDVLIILDKSGSMSGDRNINATNAVTELIQQLDESTQAGILIDVGWPGENTGASVVELSKRVQPIAPLTPQHKQDLIKLAEHPLGNRADFTSAFEEALNMAKNYSGQAGTLSILMISDGVDVSNEFSADVFADRFNALGVKVNYLYVTDDPTGEISRLATLTGGESVGVSQKQEILDQMRKMATVQKYDTVYKDALRDINESTAAKIVTGILLLLLGLLIGFSLSVMLSVQGQRRFQLILSPLMAVCTFLILAFGKELIITDWIREGVAFSLLGIVIMRTNQAFGNQSSGKTKQQKKAAPVTESAPSEEW